jgi:hypothetical protein
MSFSSRGAVTFAKCDRPLVSNRARGRSHMQPLVVIKRGSVTFANCDRSPAQLLQGVGHNSQM